MEKQKVDYSLYLVTDSTEAILGSRDLVDVVEQALSGGWFVLAARVTMLLTGHQDHLHRHKTSDWTDIPRRHHCSIQG